MVDRNIPTPDNIDRERKKLGQAMEAKLLVEAERWPNHAPGIAAKVILAERSAATADARHEQLMKEVGKPHWKTPNFWVGLVGAVSGSIAAWYSYLAYSQSPPPSDQLTQVSPTSASSPHRLASSLQPSSSATSASAKKP